MVALIACLRLCKCIQRGHKPLGHAEMMNDQYCSNAKAKRIEYNEAKEINKTGMLAKARSVSTKHINFVWL